MVLATADGGIERTVIRESEGLADGVVSAAAHDAITAIKEHFGIK